MNNTDDKNAHDSKNKFSPSVWRL